MCIINAFQLWSKGQQHLGQLRFREELMHELLQQLPPDLKPQRAGARPNPATALAKNHYLERAGTERRCALCSSTGAGTRAESRFLCQACGVHLCVGECFAAYHAGQ